MKVLRLLVRWWHNLWQPGESSSSEIDTQKWAETIERLNRKLK